MNNERRAKLHKIREQLEDSMLQVEELRNEEQDYRDGIPESFTDKQEKSEVAIACMEEIEGSIDDAVRSLENAVE